MFRVAPLIMCFAACSIQASLINIEEDACRTRLDTFCPVFAIPLTQQDLEDSANCLMAKHNLVGNECVPMIAESIVEYVDSADSECHQELRLKCGKEIDALKKDAHKTEVLGTIKDIVEVISCIAFNLEDLTKHCFGMNQIQVKTATKKPSAKTSSDIVPSKKPTKKVTIGTTESSDDAILDNAKPSKKPSKKSPPPSIADVDFDVTESSDDAILDNAKPSKKPSKKSRPPSIADVDFDELPQNVLPDKMFNHIGNSPGRKPTRPALVESLTSDGLERGCQSIDWLTGANGLAVILLMTLVFVLYRKMYSTRCSNCQMPQVSAQTKDGYHFFSPAQVQLVNPTA